jgi:hypothetical protein
MFVSDLRKEFFDLLIADSRVLVIANIDVDSICSVKILQTLLQVSNIILFYPMMIQAVKYVNLGRYHFYSYVFLLF